MQHPNFNVLVRVCSDDQGVLDPEGLLHCKALLPSGNDEDLYKLFNRFLSCELFATENGVEYSIALLKAHFITRPAYGAGKAEHPDPPELYHLGHDPSEKHNIADKHPEIIAQIRELTEAHKAAMIPGEPQLEARIE